MNKTGKGGFKKGQSGNPQGRPQGSISIIARIKKELTKIPSGQKITYVEILVKQILKKAIIDGDKEMIKLIWNYVDGMPKQALEHIGDEKRPVKILYVPAKKEGKVNATNEHEAVDKNSATGNL